jgi:dTDP-glucose 4,6-dehydratase
MFQNHPSTVLLVTGGCGFIGSHFINHIFRRQDRITILNFDALYYCASTDNIDPDVRASPRYHFIHGNLCSVELLRYVFQTHPITHVVHFAAQSHVQNSFHDSIQYTRDNVLGTHTLLEVCRTHKDRIQRFIHISTDEVYGQSMIEQKTEVSTLCPTNPYAGTKAAAELIAQTYYHSFRFPIIITRGNNVYGKNQYPEKLIPRLIHLLRTGQKATIHGDGSAIRGFLHVSDTVRAIELILYKGSIGDIYNIGCDESMEYSVMTVARMLIRKILRTEDYDRWIEYEPDRPFQDGRYYIGNQKIKDLGWNIEIPFERGIDDLLDLGEELP